MNNITYKSAMKNICTSKNFNAKTLSLLNAEKIDKSTKKSKLVPASIITISVLFIIIPILYTSLQGLTNPKADISIELENSSNGISVKYITSVPEIYEEISYEMLSEEEIFNKIETSIFYGEIVNIENIIITMGLNNNQYRSIISIKVSKNYRGNEKKDYIVRALLPIAIQSSDSKIMSAMRVGNTGIFMPFKYSKRHVWIENGRTLQLSDICEYGFYGSEHYVFIQTEEGIIYSNYAFPSLNRRPSLDDLEKYIFDMIK